MAHESNAAETDEVQINSVLNCPFGEIPAQKRTRKLARNVHRALFEWYIAQYRLWDRNCRVQVATWYLTGNVNAKRTTKTAKQFIVQSRWNQTYVPISQIDVEYLAFLHNFLGHRIVTNENKYKCANQLGSENWNMLFTALYKIRVNADKKQAWTYPNKRP